MHNRSGTIFNIIGAEPKTTLCFEAKSYFSDSMYNTCHSYKHFFRLTLKECTKENTLYPFTDVTDKHPNN